MGLILRGMVVLVLGGILGEKMQMIQGTSGSSNDALEVHSGGLVVREQIDRPLAVGVGDEHRIGAGVLPHTASHALSLCGRR